MRSTLPLAVALLAILWLACAAIFSRALAAPNIKWESVPPEQLAADFKPVESGEDQEAIFWRVWVDDELRENGFEQTRTYYIRLKILTPKGAQDRSQIHIDFPPRDVQVHDIRARTIKPDGTILPLPPKSVIKESLVREHGNELRRYSFAPIGVEPGCVIEYSYEDRRFDAAVFLQIHDLQFDFPVRELTYRTNPVDIPEWSVQQMIFHSPAHHSDGRVDGYYVTTANAIRAYHEEPDSPPEYQQRGWMLLYYTQHALQAPETFWPDYGRREAKWFDDYTRPSGETRSLAKSIVRDAASDDERVHRLADWTQHDFRIAWGDSGETEPRKNKTVDDAIEQKAGSPLDADLVFAALARAADLEVRYLCVENRREMFFNEHLTSANFLPGAQIAVRLNGSWVGFDPATRFLPWDMTHWYEEAGSGLLCDRDSSRIVDTRSSTPERSMMRHAATLNLATDGTLEGEFEIRMSGHFNSDYRWIFNGMTQAEIDSLFNDDDRLASKGMEVTNVHWDPGTDPRAPARLLGHVHWGQVATVTGKRILLQPAIYQANGPARYTSSSRRTPIYYHYPWSEEDSIAIHMPAGWKVETMDSPEPLDAAGVAAYAATTAVDSAGTTLVYHRSFRFGYGGTILIPFTSYPAVKSLFDAVHERDRSTATLTRIEGSK